MSGALQVTDVLRSDVIFKILAQAHAKCLDVPGEVGITELCYGFTPERENINESYGADFPDYKPEAAFIRGLFTVKLIKIKLPGSLVIMASSEARYPCWLFVTLRFFSKENTHNYISFRPHKPSSAPNRRLMVLFREKFSEAVIAENGNCPS